MPLIPLQIKRNNNNRKNNIAENNGRNNVKILDNSKSFLEISESNVILSTDEVK